MTSPQFRRWIYPICVILIVTAWTGYMAAGEHWSLFQEYWPMSLTMALGSFVAGSTPQGGGAVAFPVYTKVLNIPSDEARTFGLMIQSAGMTMASVFIFVRRIRILPFVITWATVGGAIGLALGTFSISIPNPYPKIIFTMVATLFGAALIISRWVLGWQPHEELPGDGHRYRLTFMSVGVLGGTFAAITGSGIDMLTFIVLTLAFGIDEKIGTPTSVVIMALISVLGFALHGAVKADIGIVWRYWLVCVPIVIFGAPLGAFVASKVNRDHIIKGLILLIGIELLSTLWLVAPPVGVWPVISAVTVLCIVWFWLMIRFRYQRLEKNGRHPMRLSTVSVPIDPHESETRS